MNCLEFCKKALADPNVLTPEMSGHLSACEKCSKFIQEMEEFDAKLVDAVEVAIPPIYHETVLTKTTQIFQNERLFIKQLAYGMAAILVLTISVVLLSNIQTPTMLENLVISHIEGEPIALQTNMFPTHETIVGTLMPLKVNLQAPLPNVRFVSPCRIGKGVGGHLVLRGEKGPITVLILPKEAITGQKTITHHNHQGYMQPVSGGGVLAVIGVPGENLASLNTQLLASISVDP